MEMMIVVAILMILTPALFNLLTDAFELNTTTSSMLAAQDDMVRIMREFAGEVRTAQPSNLGTYALLTTGTSTFTFFADTDSDGLRERIRYELEGDALVRGSIVPTGTPLVYDTGTETVQTLATGVRNDAATPLFLYYNASFTGSGSELTQPVTIGEVRSVRMEILLDTDPVNPPGPALLTTQATMRNLKDN